MAQRHHEKQKRLKQARKEREKEAVREIRETGTRLLPFLKQAGCDLPFYDFIDSYPKEFRRIADEALASSSTLAGIYEVEKRDLDDPDYRKYGFDPADQVAFHMADGFEQYGQRGKEDWSVNMRGSAVFFRHGDGFKSLVLVQDRFKSEGAPELRYVFKIATLCHELGHVNDAENRVNLDPLTKRFDVVEAEAYAHCYALDRLASRCLKQSYDPLYEVLEKWMELDNYEGDIGRLVMRGHKRRDIPNWQDFIPEAERVYVESSTRK